jgi:hypothetical protein
MLMKLNSTPGVILIMTVILSDASIANLNKMLFFISEGLALLVTTWIRNTFLSLILTTKTFTFSKGFRGCLTSQGVNFINVLRAAFAPVNLC